MLNASLRGVVRARICAPAVRIRSHNLGYISAGSLRCFAGVADPMVAAASAETKEVAGAVAAAANEYRARKDAASAMTDGWDGESDFLLYQVKSANRDVMFVIAWLMNFTALSFGGLDKMVHFELVDGAIRTGAAKPWLEGSMSTPFMIVMGGLLGWISFIRATTVGLMPYDVWMTHRGTCIRVRTRGFFGTLRKPVTVPIRLLRLRDVGGAMRVSVNESKEELALFANEALIPSAARLRAVLCGIPQQSPVSAAIGHASRATGKTLWQEAKDKATGKTYYWNISSREARWSLPE